MAKFKEFEVEVEVVDEDDPRSIVCGYNGNFITRDIVNVAGYEGPYITGRPNIIPPNPDIKPNGRIKSASKDPIQQSQPRKARN